MGKAGPWGAPFPLPHEWGEALHESFSQREACPACIPAAAAIAQAGQKLGTCLNVVVGELLAKISARSKVQQSDLQGRWHQGTQATTVRVLPLQEGQQPPRPGWEFRELSPCVSRRHRRS